MKLKWKNLIILLFGALCLGLFVGDWLVILFQGATFTLVGIIVNLIELCGLLASIMYFENYLERK